MANHEHVEALKLGAQGWKRWREEHRVEEVDLRGASLDSADLTGYDLHGADFTAAAMADAILDFSDGLNVIFRETRLPGASFFGTVLTNADFRAAYLISTTFTWCTFSSVNMSAAILAGTVFAGVNMAGVIGLDQVIHQLPSTIGLDTFFMSGGLPESFLRGAGVPEEFIQYASALLGKPIEYYSCFISHSSRDDEFTKRLYADLQARKIRTWFAPEDLKIGDRFRSAIDTSIRLHDKLVLVLSKDAIDSTWVETEVETAFERERKEKRDVLFPITIDDAVCNANAAWAREIVRTRHIGDFRPWKSHDDYTRALDRLVRDLKKEGPIVMRG